MAVFAAVFASADAIRATHTQTFRGEETKEAEAFRLHTGVQEGFRASHKD